jgi:predicted PurR-regulated permease PerM
MDSYFSRPFTFDRVVRLIIAFAMSFLLFFMLRYLSGVLLPFCIAWLLAYILHPLVEWVQRFVKYKVLAIFLVLLGIISTIVSFFFFLVPTFIDEFIRFKNILVASGEIQNGFIPQSWVDSMQAFSSQIDIKEMLSLPKLLEVSKIVFPHAWSLFSDSLNIVYGLFGLIFVLIYLFFILRDQQSINRGFLRLIPHRHKAFFVGMLQDLKLGMSLYFRRQFIIAFLDAIMFCVGFLIIGMPMGIVMGILLGILNMIPYMQYLGLPFTAMLMALKATENGSSIGMALLSLAIVFMVVQVVQDFYLTPKIMGNSMGLNPAIVLLSLSVWGYLLGVLGLIIALPVTTILKSYYQRYILKENPALPFRKNGKE